VVTTLAGAGGKPRQRTTAPAAGARFNYPHGVAVDFSTNVYVADRSSFTIRKITPLGLVTTLAGGGKQRLRRRHRQRRAVQQP